jgi:aspartyl-tRNA(Asn)/glutamyl-tRNA(Gln) amidotransferase subunit A
MAWTVEDVAIMLQSVAGFDPEDPSCADVPVPSYCDNLTGTLSGLVIGIPYRWIEEDVPASQELRNAFDTAIDVFRGLGAVVRSVKLPPLVQYEDTKKIMAVCELFATHGNSLRVTPELFGANFRFRVMGGGIIRAEDYIIAMQTRAKLARAIQTSLTEVDVLMTPTEEPARLLGDQTPDSLFTHCGYLTAFNVSGNPSLALCMGFARSGLPISLQIVGRLFDEGTVLRTGNIYEKATPWRNRRPALATQATTAGRRSPGRAPTAHHSTRQGRRYSSLATRHLK